MAVTRTFIDRCNTIVKGSDINLGINPVAELNFGGGTVSRILLHFPIEKIKGLVEDGTYPDISKLSHQLVLFNCASLDNVTLDKKINKSDYSGLKERASSCDILFFLIPMDWDGGRGFDWVRDASLSSRHVSYSTYGSNWFNAKSGLRWSDVLSERTNGIDKDGGIYSSRKLSLEYDKFSSSNPNVFSDIVIQRFHFEYGNENVKVDITDTVNKMITGEIKENYGIGICFSPRYEEMETRHNMTQYIGFFTPYTNSFYEPYLESRHCDHIEDSRNKFYLDKGNNRLYFYSVIGGKPRNLDNIPSCVIDKGSLDMEVEVKQATKGVYYAEVEMDSDKFDPGEMHYDTWSNLSYNGKALKDVEMDFVTKDAFSLGDGYYEFGDAGEYNPKSYVPNVKGILFGEKMRRGDVRKVIVEARVPYTTNEMEVISEGMYYRLYVKDGVDEVDVICWDTIEQTAFYNYFLIDTSELLPQKYFLDIKMESDLEVKHFREVLTFDIVSDVTERYR